MAEVTRVPLQPIAKGSLAKFWLGVLVGVLIAGAIAWFTTREPGVSVDTLVEGQGASPTKDDIVFVHYTGRLADDGTVFDQSQDIPWPVPGVMPDGAPLPLAQMIPGFQDALLQMQKGGKYTVRIPAEKGYGATPPPNSPIPPDADLEFDIELVDFMSTDEAQQRYTQLMAAMQQSGEGVEGAPADAPPAAAPVPVE